MGGRFSQVAVVVVIVLLAALIGQPYLDRLLFAQTSPRPVAARSELGESERATISLFERVSPSVVQVVGAGPGAAGAPEMEMEGGGGGGGHQSGTGFVWDGAGHIVTNNHVVSGARNVAIRFASGEVVGASIV